MSAPKLLRLQHIEVQGLFSIYDHKIDLNLMDRVTILHGQNGVGKTIVLRMINAFLRGNLDIFNNIPFSKFLMTFNDGNILELFPKNDHESLYVLRLRQKELILESSELNLQLSVDVIAQSVSHLAPIEDMPNAWEDVRDGEILSDAEVLSRYGSRNFKPYGGEDITWFTEFLENANAYLIEEQRLLRTNRSRGPRAMRRSYWSSGGDMSSSMISAVVECGRDFQERFNEAMINYGRQSQALDQSFPQRLISATEKLEIGALKERMTALDNKTSEFTAIGILDKIPSHPFEVESLGDIDDTQARIMSLYVSDTETKLAVLEDLARRTRLLLDNMNRKYSNKRIVLDRKSGFIAENNDDTRLPLDALSSGEKHELVLHYDLLFRVPMNTIVLIDEPELSLHVLWQKSFLTDLLEIIELSDFDAVIATHSPYIVGDREDLMVGIG